jgi:HSP90 family molecular chaperone
MFCSVKEEDESISKYSNIDITSIIKNVETCIKTGLDEKLQDFFSEYERFEKTHNEVLNLTIVRNLKNHRSYSKYCIYL